MKLVRARPGGVYLCVSYGVPATRMGYLKTATLDWTVSFEKIGKPEVHGYGEMGAAPHHYVYACTKPSSQAR